MIKAILALLPITAVVLGSPVAAAETSTTETDRLQHLFELYASKPQDGKAPFVSVVPAGEAYKVSFDLRHMLELVPAAVGTVDVSPIVFSLEPLQDGTWHVSMADRIKVEYASSAQSGSYVFDQLKLDAIFDPAIAASRTLTIKVPTLTSTTTSMQNTGEVVVHDIVQTATGTRGPDETTNISVVQTVGTFTEKVSVPVPSPVKPQDATSLDLELKAAGDKSTADIIGLRSKQLLDLWAYLVAHSGNSASATADDGIKVPLEAALPLFDTLRLDGTVSDLSLKWIFGSATVGSYSIHLGASTQSPSNTADFNLKIADLAISSGFIPEPAHDLLPTKLDVSVGAKDFDFGNAIKTMIELYDFAHPDPLFLVKNDAQIRAAWVPTGKMTVQIPPSGIYAPAYTIAFQGTVELSPAHAKTHFDVRMGGFDQVVKVLTQVKAPGAPQMLVGLYAASAMAKKDPDGSLEWAIDVEDNGLIVNGKPVGPQPKKSL